MMSSNTICQQPSEHRARMRREVGRAGAEGGEKLATRVGSGEMVTAACGSGASCSLSNLNARINAHWTRGKQRDRSDTPAGGRALSLSPGPLYASIGAGHVRRKLTRRQRRRDRARGGGVGDRPARSVLVRRSAGRSGPADRGARRRPFGIDHARRRQRSCVRRVPKGSTCPNAVVARDADGLTRRQPTLKSTSFLRSASSAEHRNRSGLRSA